MKPITGKINIDGEEFTLDGMLMPTSVEPPVDPPVDPLAIEELRILDKEGKYTAVAVAEHEAVARVDMAIAGIGLTSERSESVRPYTLFGDSEGRMQFMALRPGVYTVTAVAYDASGKRGLMKSKSFDVSDTPVDPPVDPPPDPDPPPPGQADGTYRGMLVGMNTSWNTYWVPDWPFADAVNCMRPPDNIIVSGIGPHVPAGDYVLTWDGAGEVSLNTGETIISEPGRKVVRVSPGNEYLALEMSDGLTMEDVHCWFPGQEGRMFHTDYVAAMSNFAVVRHLNWGRVNDSDVVTWADRKQSYDPRQQGRPGVAYEYMAWLANECQNDPWVCVPWLADDDHIRRMAKLFLEELDPDRKIYVEFTNEFWNTIFDQGDWAWNAQTGETAGEKMGRRIANNHKIWDQVWREAGERDRLVLCVMGQAFGHFTTKQMVLRTEANGGPIDAIGVAGYFGTSTDHNDVDRMIDGLRSNARRFPQDDDIEKSKALADERGVPFYLYECGHHLEVLENQAMTEETLAEVMRDPRMADVYRIALDRYADFGCDMVVFFDYANRIRNKAFGHVEYQGQPLSEAPKMRALIEGMRKR